MDIYADDSTQQFPDGNRLEIVSESPDIKKELENLFFKNTAVNSKLWEIVRTTCLYGDSMYEIILTSDRKSVVGIKWLPPKTMFRVEQNGRLRGFIQEVPQGEPTKFMPFEIVHFKLLSTVSHFNPYGTSIMEAARRTWRQLKLMEDAMVVYRVSRAPERRVFKVFVGNLPPAKASQVVEEQRKRYRKRPFVNQKTGQVDFRANSIAPDEDFWIPVNTNGNGTEIDTLPGAENLGEIDDVKYFKDKIFATLKIPRIWLQDVEGSEERRQNLSQQDIRFSRTIERVQSQIIEGLNKIATVHLMVRGYKKEQLDDFQIKLAPPSNINEVIEIELLDQQANLASSLYDFGFSKEWIAENVFKMDVKEWKKVLPVKIAEEAALMSGEADSNPYVAPKEEDSEEENPNKAGEIEKMEESIAAKTTVAPIKTSHYNKLLFEGEIDGIERGGAEEKKEKVKTYKYLSDSLKKVLTEEVEVARKRKEAIEKRRRQTEEIDLNTQIYFDD
jgi:hypothetical protein